MMRTVSLFGAVFAALVLLISPVVGATADGDDRTTKEILIHTAYTDCDEDEEDCEPLHLGAHRVVIAGDDHHAIHFGADGQALAGGYLGVQLTNLTPELRTHFGVGEDNGVMIAKIVDDSPAWRAGLQVGDIITAVNSQEVSSGGSLARAIRDHEEGEQVSLEVWRDGRLETITATLEERQPFLTAGRGVHIVECKDGTCTCTVNGEVTDCDVLHRPHHDRD